MTVNMTIDVLFKIAEVLEVHPARLLDELVHKRGGMMR